MEMETKYFSARENGELVISDIDISGGRLEGVEGFSGDKANAAYLLGATIEGVRWTEAQLRSIDPNFNLEPLMVAVAERSITKGNPATNLEVYDHITGRRLNAVVIDRGFLEGESIQNPLLTCQVTRADREVCYVGKRPHLFGSFGVEESHHAHVHTDRGQQIEPLGVSLADYDAIDHEYRALSWQLRHAQESGFPPETVNVLSQRFDRASNRRKSKGKWTIPLLGDLLDRKSSQDFI